MLLRFYRCALGLVLLCLLVEQVRADRVLSYRINDGRLLSLIRKPAVLDDLKLDAEQRTKIERLNATIDEPLLRLRNWRENEAKSKILQLVRNTQVELQKILRREQFNRLAQIAYYAQGHRTLLGETLTKKLSLDEKQVEAISKIVEANNSKLAFQSQGVELSQKAGIDKVLKQEDAEIIKLLTDEQQKQLADLAGPVFDRSKLTGVRFRAPDFVDGEWLHTEKPLRLKEVRGKVLIIHFWAFG